MIEAADEDATNSQNQEPVNQNEEDPAGEISDESELLSSPGYLKHIFSKFMYPLRAAKSLALKKAVIIAMMTVTIAAVLYYSPIYSQQLTHDLNYETVKMLDLNNIACSQAKNNVCTIEFIDFLEAVYQKTCECVLTFAHQTCLNLRNASSTSVLIQHCQCSLKKMNLDASWNSISTLATLWCSNNTVCNYFLSKLPDAATCWTTVEAFWNSLPSLALLAGHLGY